MRYFIAIDIPEDIKIEIREIQKKFEKYTSLKFVNPDQYHLTLAFLGDVDEIQLNETKEVLWGVSESYSGIRCHLSGMGVFPDNIHIRVVWIGMSVDNDLFDLQKKLASQLRERGILRLDTQFKPHITIARVHCAKNKDSILEAVNNNAFRSRIFEINELKLKRSVLSGEGPMYETISIHKLRELE